MSETQLNPAWQIPDARSENLLQGSSFVGSGMADFEKGNYFPPPRMWMYSKRGLEFYLAYHKGRIDALELSQLPKLQSYKLGKKDAKTESYGQSKLSEWNQQELHYYEMGYFDGLVEWCQDEYKKLKREGGLRNQCRCRGCYLFD
jgi:hypothetical protein